MDGVEQSEILTRIFGRWPSFHDAEVVRIALERRPDGPSLEAQIRVFEVTSEIDSSGHSVHKNETLVSLLFLGVELEHLKGFNTQNVIASLDIAAIPSEEPGRSRFRVELPSLYGLDAVFECERAVVLAAEPYTP